MEQARQTIRMAGRLSEAALGPGAREELLQVFRDWKREVSMEESDLPAKLAAPARRALASVGCVRLEQVARLSEREAAGLHGIGPSGIKLLKQALAEQGLAFREEKK